MKKLSGVHISDLVMEETNRGIFYTASIRLNNKKVGSLENPGDGSYTRIYIIEQEDRGLFNEKMQDYFKELGWDTSDESSHSLDYTFAEHLIELFEEGKVSQGTLQDGFYV